MADTFSAVQCPSFLLVIFQGRKQDISIAICLYFPALFCLTHTPYHPVVLWLISAENEMLLQLQWSSMFQALLVDALFFSPSGNFKNQASIELLLLMCICTRLTCWNIRRFPKDWMTISRPQRTPSLLQRRAPQDLPRNPWASPGAQSGPTESDEGTPCLQMFVLVLEGLRF